MLEWLGLPLGLEETQREAGLPGYDSGPDRDG